MGLCFSRSDSDRVETGSVNGIPTGSNKPLVPREQLRWTSERPITKAELERQREAFWDTAPAYSGRQEIWQALRAACEAPTLDTAQAIVDSVNITIPTGHLSDGCYDELGNHYVVPVSCLVEPRNLVADTEGEGKKTGNSEQKDSAKTDIHDRNNPSSPPTALPRNTIILRLSTGKDVKLSVTGEDTIKQVKAMLEAKEEISKDTPPNLRFFYLGRPVTETTTMNELKLGDGGLLQVYVT